MNLGDNQRKESDMGGMKMPLTVQSANFLYSFFITVFKNLDGNIIK